MDRRVALRTLAGSALAVVLPRISTALDLTPRDPQVRLLRFSLALENPSSTVLRDQNLWLYLPVARTGTQVLENYAITAANQISYDDASNTICAIHFDELAPYATKIIGFSTQVNMSEMPAPSAVPAIVFLSSATFVEVDTPAIAALAGNLLRDTPIESARAIYNWVRANLHYAGYIAEDMGAAWSLLNRKGDCTEFAFLAAALARANRIPARVVGGYFAERDKILKAGDYHNWAELYLDGAWRLLDAQKGHFLESAEAYIAFEVISPKGTNPLNGAHRFRTGGGSTARMI